MRAAAREQGRFQIDSVEAGTYIIIFNYENTMTTRMPFPKLYYPGVPEREKAKTITLKHGESANDLNVVIKALKTIGSATILPQNKNGHL
ncbi:MAG TPA: hypothetical protein VK208_11755 [Pyrinomonadaceae bacterium]|nr:hypothetical protein [Pyrinomonadaceae bacterium]